MALDYPDYEVMVVDDGSKDDTPAILKQFADRIILITNSSPLGPSRSRNAAARLALGEYIAFTDADCIVDKFWLKELLTGFSASGVVSSGGSQGIPQDESGFGRRVSKFMRKTGFIVDYMRIDKGRILKVGHNPSCNVMYKKDIFLGEGGFCEGLWPGEDVEIDYRLRKKGHTLVFNPKALVYHYRPDNLKKFSRMMFRYGLVQGFLVRKYGMFRKLHFLPIVSVIFILMFLSLGYLNSFLFFLLLAAVSALAAVYLADYYLLLLAIVTLAFWHAGFVKGFSRHTL